MLFRKLKPKEIEYILDFIKPNKRLAPEIAKDLVERYKKEFRYQLIDVCMNPGDIDELKEQIAWHHFTSLIQAGESVGIICAQSLGEKNTQMTLNTFHKAGQSEKGMTAGIPRFKEIINATKNPESRSCKIYFNKRPKSIKEIRKIVGHNIVGLTLGDISVDMDVIQYKDPEPWYGIHYAIYGVDISMFEYCISVQLNVDKLYQHKLSIETIANSIEEKLDDVMCIFSPLQKGRLDIYVDVSAIDMEEEQVLYVDQENKEKIYLEDCSIPALKKLKICGIEGISEIYYIKEGNEWIVETEGSNLSAILAHPEVDKVRTFTNDIWDTYNTIGIEAARKLLLIELVNIMEDISMAQIKLFVDRMTYTGTLCGLDRYTMKKGESGPLSKASFEESMDNLLNAAVRCDVEPTMGVSASIICGKRAKLGTGCMDLYMDMDFLEDDETEDIEPMMLGYE